METGAGTNILAGVKSIGRNVRIGDDVHIECDELVLGDDVSIGMPTDETFRYPGGVRIRVKSLVLEDNVRIDQSVLIRGGKIHFARDVTIQPWNTIDVRRQLQIGEHGVVNTRCEITGRDVVIGRELWMLPEAKIGGGSAFEVHSELRVGDYCHIGMRSFINTARRVRIGNEVGLGTGTSLYTHGAYPSALQGFPVSFGEIAIGDYTWIPGAIVNPGVKIGKNCVIGVNSLVNRDVPDGCLAAGSPAKVVREKAFPKVLSAEQRSDFFRKFLLLFGEICGDRCAVHYPGESDGMVVVVDGARITFKDHITTGGIAGGEGREICIGNTVDPLVATAAGLPDNLTVLDAGGKKAYGLADELSSRLVNQLRRYGIRLYASPRGDRYLNWP